MHALLLVYLDWFPIAPLLCANLYRDYFVVEEMNIKLGRDGVRRPVQPQVACRGNENLFDLHGVGT